LSEEINFGNVPLQDEKKAELTFPNGKTSLKFDDFFSIVKESCADKEQAENYLIHAFSMFDRKKKGYINSEDLKEVFKLLGE
jgi:Ca2+-binding EF-hand superfamily protein